MIECDKCGDGIDVDDEPGALAFSPPATLPGGRRIVEKLHICRPCWTVVEELIRPTPDQGTEPKPCWPCESSCYNAKHGDECHRYSNGHGCTCGCHRPAPPVEPTPTPDQGTGGG